MRLIEKIKLFGLTLLSFLPTRLPQGITEFQGWVDDIVAIGSFPESLTRDSVEFSLATMILHLGPTASSKPKRYFIVAVKAAAAKQVAHAAFYDLKMRQAEAAEKAKQEAEATAKLTVVPSNEVLRDA